MSYRRDSRRDNNSRNLGNFGGGMNRRQNYGGGLNQVSPWQGGIVPGMGLLGPGGGQSSLLSQLSSPEAQLAMATNLLNKILSPQEQTQPATPPSLLSLPINRNMASFNDSRSRWTSYADRRRDNRPDNRRMQPYNKSGSNRHQDGKSRFGSEKTSRFNSDKTGSPKSKQKMETDKKVKGEENLNGDADDEDKESKRKEEDEDDEGKKKDEAADSKASIAKFNGVPQALLACHVCHKNMWDATSFDKHVSGRRHQMMMEQQDETYKIKVELLRHEQRASESQREMEIDRLQRQGKKVFNNKRAYCTMCDLHFFGNLISHRKKDRHQKLKAFLHPKCRLCHKEFANRLEWDDHKLTANHLLKVADHRRSKKPGIKDEEIEFQDSDSLDEEDDDLFSPTKDRKIKFDLTDIPNSIEDYDPMKTVGELLVTEVVGHLCRGCGKFLASKDEVESHLHTFTHYKNYALLVKAKVKAEKDKAKKDKPTKDGEEDEDADGEEEEEDEEEEEHSEGEKPSAGGDSEGTWKRRKRGSGAGGKANNGTADEDDADQEEDDEEEEVIKKENVKQEEMEVEAKSEKYDPDQADEEEEEEQEEPEVPKTPRGPASRNKATRGGGRGGKARRGGK